MKYLCIDYGAKRIGLALSDEGGAFAFPKGVIPNDAKALETLREMVAKEKVARLVYGDTRAVNGVENPITQEAEGFVQKLADEAGIPADPVWEAWSSVEAARFAPKGKEHDDAAAAAVILQRYLETHQST